MSQKIVLDRQLNKWQAPFWRAMDSGIKRVSLIWHRRQGKDEVSLMRTRNEAFKTPGNYWHMLPKQTQARESIWLAINSHTGVRRIDEMFPPALRIKTNEQRMEITVPSGPDLKQEAIWSLKGSDSYDSLLGAGPRGIVFSEWPISDPMAWALTKPMLEESGGWAIFQGSSRGKNHAYHQFVMAQESDEWFSSILPISKTKALPQKQLDGIMAEYEALYGLTLGRALYAQEYECSFESAVLGSVYGEAMSKALMSGRIGRWPHVPGVRCFASFDIGRRDSTVVWISQIIAGEIRHLHCYQMVGEAANPDRVVSVLRESDYDIAVCVLPHDAQHQTASNKGVDYRQQVIALGYGVIIAPNLKIEQGISLTRQMLAQSTFNKENCDSEAAKGISAIEIYHYEYDRSTRILSVAPVHDWTSHYADALRMAAVTLDKVRGWLLTGNEKKINVMQRRI